MARIPGTVTKATDTLSWLRDKATVYSVSEIMVEGVPYRVTGKSFRGFLPRYMVSNLKKNLTSLIKTECVNEAVLLKNGQVEYLFNSYDVIGDVK